MEIVFSLLAVLDLFALPIFVNVTWRATADRLPYFMRASSFSDVSQSKKSWRKRVLLEIQDIESDNEREVMIGKPTWSLIDP